jgi:UDP-N-acetylglucosamine 2-epimerase (non-hydrolysing)
MASRHILFVFGTRPEAIKLFPVIKALESRAGLEISTCVTAQHRGLLDQVLDIAGVRPDFDLNIMEPNQSLDRLTARLIIEVGRIMDSNEFSRVIVQGDTATAMASTLAAYYRKVPVAHVEAGLRSGNIYHPWPEEVNRRMIAPIADLHFAPTQTAAEALRREGVTQGVYVTGNTVIDALHATIAAVAADPTLASSLDSALERVGDRRVVLVTTHRRENFGDSMIQIASAIAKLAEREDVFILFPVHPNPSVVSTMDEVLPQRSNILRIAPMDYPSFVRALDRSYLVLTDSGGVQEEAPALGKPVLVMRETTERPEGIMAGTARLVGADAKRIVAEATELLDDSAAYARMARSHNPFGDGKSAVRIADIISAS